MNKVMIAIALILAVASLLIGVKVNIQESQIPAMESQLANVVVGQNQIVKKLQEIEKQQQALSKVVTNLGKGLTLGKGPTRANRNAQRRPQEDPNKVYAIKISDSPVFGKKDAKVTIVEFSDMQCPYSQRFHTVMSDVLAAYPNDVKYVLKQFPLKFHSKAKPASKAAFAAGEQGKYWEMVSALFKNGRSLSEEKFIELAGQIGLDVEKFKKDLKDKDAQWEKKIADDIATGISVTVHGTPTFFINGKKTRSRDLESWKKEIDAILKQKK